jgi:hypothetical protein
VADHELVARIACSAGDKTGIEQEANLHGE